VNIVKTATLMLIDNRQMRATWGVLTLIVGILCAAVIIILNNGDLAFLWLNQLEPFWQMSFVAVMAFGTSLVLTAIVLWTGNLLALTEENRGARQR